MKKYNEETDKYNSISINLFMFPILFSLYYGCEIFLIQSTLLWFVGSVYHNYLKKNETNTPLLIFLRYLDMFVVHTVSTYIFYYRIAIKQRVNQ